VRRLEWPPERRGQEASAQDDAADSRRNEDPSSGRDSRSWSVSGVLCGRTSRKVAGHLRHCRRQLPVSIYDNGAAMSDQGALGEKRELAAKVLRDVLERMGVDAEVSAFDDGRGSFSTHMDRSPASHWEERRDAGCASVPGEPNRVQEAG